MKIAVALLAVFIAAFLASWANEHRLLKSFPKSSGADSDGDGMSDADEQLAGTDPNLASSVFRLLGPPERETNGLWHVRWSSVPGRTYQVQRAAADELNTNWTQLAELSASTFVTSFTDTNAVSGRRFYRVRVNGVIDATYFDGDPDRFVPLDSNGQPIDGALIPLNPDGSLTPFEFRPAGRSLAGARDGLFIRFPVGARVTNDGAQQLIFSNAVVSFGSNSPFQLASHLVLNGTALKQFTTSPLDVATLATLFTGSTNGLDVLLFGRFPLRLVKGVFSDAGLVGAQIALPNLSLPLPGVSGDYPGRVIDITEKGGIRIPFSGRFPLPDSSSYVPTVTVPTNRPLWLEFFADGRAGLHGRADIQFTNGPSFSVMFDLEDPFYYLRIEANKVHVPLLDSLVDLLPNAPAVPNTSDAAQLTSVRQRLECFDKAMANFSAATVNAAPASFDAPTAIPDEAFATASSVLDAWGFAASCSSGMSPNALRGAVKHASEVAASAPDLKGVLAQRLALLRLHQAMGTGGLSSDAPLEEELTAALADAQAAAIVRAQQNDAVKSLGSMRQTLACLLEIEMLRQQLGLAASPELIAAMRNLLQRFTVDLTASLRVNAGNYATPSAVIAAMNRFTALDHLRQLVELLSMAQQLGLDSEINAPTGEAIGQLATRTWSLLNAALLSAEAAGDYTAFTYALEDALEFIALRQSGVFPNHASLSSLPEASALNSYPSRLDAVFQADAAKPVGERSLNNLKQDLARLTRILRQLPNNFTYSPTPIQRAYDCMEARLTTSFNVINTLTPVELKCVLEAGIAKAELRDLFNLGEPVSWETTRLPQIITRFATVAGQSNAWADLHAATGILLKESDRHAALGNQQRRQLYLSKAAELAAAARTVAVALWQNEETRRNANPLLQAADMALPGDIFVDRVAGSLSYDRHQRALGGHFSGELRLPKFGLALNVQHATFGGGGAFSLNAFGQTYLGTTNSSLGTVTVPGRRPLKISFTPPRDLRLDGSAQLALNNGMTFEAHAKLDDPQYEFGFAAGGLRFDLATNLFGYVPVLDTAALQNLGPDVRAALSEYYRAMSATAEPLSSFANAPRFREVGEPPSFEESVIVISTDGLNAGLNVALLCAVAPAALGLEGFNATLPVLTNIVRDVRLEFRRLELDLGRARAEFENATGDAKSEARRVLIRKLNEAGKTLVKAAEASRAIVGKQTSGQLPNTPAIDPTKTPEAQDAKKAVEDGLKEAGDDFPLTPRVVVDAELGLANSWGEYVATGQLLGGFAPDFQQRTREYVVNGRNRLFSEFYGMDGQGNVTNQAKFDSLTDAQLLEAAQLSAELAELGLHAEQPDALQVHERAAMKFMKRRLQLNATELKKVRNPEARFELPSAGREHVEALRQERERDLTIQSIEILHEMQTLNAEFTLDEGYDGTPGPVNGFAEYERSLSGLSTSLGKLAEAISPESPRYDADYVLLTRKRDLVERLKKVGIQRVEPIIEEAKADPRIGPAVVTQLRVNSTAVARENMNPLREWAAAGAKFPIEQAEFIGRELIGMARLLEEPSASSAAAKSATGKSAADDLLELKLQIIPAYTVRITALAEAQKAWWLAGRISEVFLEGIRDKAQADLTVAEQAMFDAAQNTVGASANILKALRDDVRLRNKPIDLPLPGDILVNGVFGDVFYNRSNGTLRASFGGRIEFPDLQNAYFEITNATLANDLTFSIAARTAGPLPFDGVWVTASMNATGGVNRPLVFSGNGTMTLTNGPDLSVGLSFNTQTRELSFDTGVGDLESWHFTDNLVLFDAGFGFSVRPAAQAGELRVNGAAGFFAKRALGSNVVASNFFLFADNVRAAVAFQPERIDLTFSNGTLRLPDFFSAGLCDGAPAAAGPSITLNPANPVRATFLRNGPGGVPDVSFAGELSFANLGVKSPDMNGLGAELCTATLKFPGNGLPIFTNISGTVRVPLPPGQTSRVDLLNGAWAVNGLPSGTIALGSDLKIIDFGGASFTFLGLGNATCPKGTSLTIEPAASGQIPVAKLDGGIQLRLPAAMLTRVDGDTVQVTACGSVRLVPNQFPEFNLQTVAFKGTFHLGGPNGLLISGERTIPVGARGGEKSGLEQVFEDAEFSLQGMENIFDLSPANPISLRLSGQLQVPNGPAFILQDARFTFTEYIGLPQFSVAGLGYNATQFPLMANFPAAVDKALITFKAPGIPLPDLLAPTNIALKFSARVAIPPEDPFIGGRVDDIGLSITPEGFLSIDSIGGLGLDIGVGNLPPIEEIGGRLYIGGLENGNPAEMYFVGRVAGSYQGYKLKMLMAFNLAGPIGMCLDVNAGAAGIPLAQSTFLFTGAGGGISFLNNGGDPCEFTNYIAADGKPLSTVIGGFPLPIAMGWPEVRQAIQNMQQRAAAYASVPTPSMSKAAPAKTAAENPILANGFDCPGGCPPATVNIFCQPHPDPARFGNRVILKFTSIDERTLNEVFGVTPELFSGGATDAAALAISIAHSVRLLVESNIPPVHPEFPGDAAAINSAITQTLDATEQAYAAALNTVLSTNVAANFYAAIRDFVYLGAPCPDITMKVFGTLSQAAVSSFLSVTGGGQITTAGNGGVFGQINFLGMPIGVGKVFVAGTDDKGLPNPSACGEIEVKFGPLDLGLMRAEMSCRDCVTGILREFYKLVQCLGEPLVRSLASNAAPRLAEFNLPAAQWLNQMTDVEKIGFMAEIYKLPPGTVNNLPQCFITQFRSTIDVFQPYLVMCGVIEPKLFGLPLAGRLAEASAEVSKTNIAALVRYSPSRILSAAYSFTLVARQLFPVDDDVTLGYNIAMPDPAQGLLAGMEGKLSSPEALRDYTAQQFDYMLQHSTYIMQFELKPVGAKGLDTQARVVLPNFTNHPARPGSGWQMPELVNTNLLTREDLLLALLETDKLVDPFWDGGNLGEIDDRLEGFSLRKDYFPHGGFLGAAKIAMPRALTEEPPDYLPGLLNPNSDMPPLERLLNALDYAQNYLTSFTNRGSLAFYVPAPNPPFFTNSSGQNLGPKELLAAISSFDVKQITNAQMAALYPTEVAFIKGYFNASLLGVPMATGIVQVIPPGTNSDAIFRVEVKGTPEGWLSHLVVSNDLVFDMRASPPRSIESWANQAMLELAELSLNPDGLSESEFNDLIRQRVADFTASFATNLPKMKLQSDLALQIPGPMSNLLAFTTGARLHAYSPMFEPDYETNNFGPIARVRREGGLAFQGNALLKLGPLTLAEVSNAEFSVVPRGNSIPAISARINAPVVPVYYFLTFTNVNIDVANEPMPRISASGGLSPFSIGSFNFAPGSGLLLGGGFSATSTSGSNVNVSVQINPCELLCPVISYTDKLLVYGASRNQPFTFSTSGPWTATLEITNKLNLLNLVEFGAGGVAGPITLAGNGTNAAGFTARFGPGAGITLFPTQPTLRTNITLQAGIDGVLTANTAGRFMFQATLGGPGLKFGNITAPAGATLTASNEGVSITWFINNGAASASLNINTNGQLTFSGTTELPPLELGVFRITGADGGNIRGAFDDHGFAVESGAKLRLVADWLEQQALSLSTFTISNSGGMRVAMTSSPGSLLFQGLPFDLTAFSFDRAPTNGGSGVARLALEGALRSLELFPGFPSLTFTGSVSSAGAVFLKSGAASASLFGFPVQNITNELSIAAGQYASELSTEFRLGDNSALWSELGNNRFVGGLRSDGSASFQATSASVGLGAFTVNNPLFLFAVAGPGAATEVRLEGDVTVSGFPLLRVIGNAAANGAFNLNVTTPNAFPYAQLTSASLTLTNNALLARGTLQLSPLPNVSLNGSVQSSGAFTLTGLASGSMNGFGLNSGTVTLQRTAGGDASVTMNNASVAVPGFGNRTFSGAFTNNGTFRISASAIGPAFTGLPVPGMSSSFLSTFSLTHLGMQLTGLLSTNGGVLSTVLPLSAVNGTVFIGSDGSQTLSAAATIASLTNGAFRITNAAGGPITATLDNAGLRFSGAVLAYSNFLNNGAWPLPEIVIGANGDFRAVVDTPTTETSQVRGYPVSSLRFTLQRVANVISLGVISGELSVPGLNVAATVSGGFTNNGTFLLSGTVNSGVNLQPAGLPGLQLTSGALVHFDHNSLHVSGGLSGGVLSFVPVSGSATGLLSVASSGSVTLGGSTRLSPLDFGALRLESTQPGGGFDASWSGNQLSLPAGLRLLFNGGLIQSNQSAVAVSANGDFSFSRSGVSFTLGGFAVTNANFSFTRSAGIAGVNVSLATLKVPGLTAALDVGVDGGLRSDGSYSLESLINANGTFGYNVGGLPLVNVGGGVHVLLENGLCTVDGNLSGGVLGFVPVVGTARGGFRITASGVVAVSAFGSVTHGDLDFGLFDIRRLDGGNFVSTLDNAGLRMPNDGRLYFDNVVLGSFNLPAITIPPSGNFSGNVNNVAAQLLGFNLSGVNFSFQKNAAGFSLPSFSGTLQVPGLGINVPLSGGIPSNGLFEFANSSLGSPALPNLPPGNFAVNATLRLTRTGGGSSLTVQGNVTGGILDVVPEASSAATLTIGTEGSLALSGNITLNAIQANPFFIEGAAGNLAQMTARWSNDGLAVDSGSARLRFGTFSVTIPLPTFTIPRSGNISLGGVTPAGALQALNIAPAGANIPFRNVSIDIQRTPSAISIPAFRGRLNVPLFTDKWLAGSISSAGSFNLAQDVRGFVMGTLPAPLGRFTMTGANPTLFAQGLFELVVQGRSLGTVNFEGNVNASGNYALSSIGNWSLGNFIGVDAGSAWFNSLGTARGGSLALSPAGLYGSDVLSYGGLEVPIWISSATSSGISFSGSTNLDSGWIRFLDAPTPPHPGCLEKDDVYGYLKGTVSVNANASNGSFGAGIGSLAFAWWIVTDHVCQIPNRCTCRTPVPFDEVQNSQKAYPPGVSISSDGRVCVNENQGGHPSFYFRLWPTPGLGSSNGRCP